jgi:hypothetical protein
MNEHRKYIYFGLVSALNLSLLWNFKTPRESSQQQKLKLNINLILTTIWLIYAMCYKDYLVMSLCVIILLHNMDYF